jgi:hypothetical protein
MEIPVEEFLSPAVEILWDALGAKKTIRGINIKQLLTKQLYLALAESRVKGQTKNNSAKTSTKELKHIVSDLMKLRRIALKMQSKERKILFYALLMALATATLENEAAEKISKEVTR